MKITCWKGLFVLGMFLTCPATLSAQEHCKNSPAYFQYNASAIKELSQKQSDEQMSYEELIKWDEITADLVREDPSVNSASMYAYLYTAQKEAAFLSCKAHGQFMGSLGPISAQVLALFFSAAPQEKGDEYSEELAHIVFAKIQQRFEEERRQIKSFPIDEKDPRLKDLPQPYIGIKMASYKPWLLKDPKQFMASQPPLPNDPYWKQQSEIVKQAAKNVTKQQLEAAQFWAGRRGPKSGAWMAIVDDYMFSHNVPFSKIVCVRSTLAEAGVDIDIAIFYSKYTYVIKRPSTINPTIEQHIEFPKHPSYPSGHSTWSPACATILSYYFPEEKHYWFQLAEEAGYSRIWGGIHYPIDHQNGWALGVQLGKAILESPKLCR